MSKEIYQSLKEMVDMMDCGDEYGKDSPWHQRATKALNEYSHSSTQELLRLKELECEQLAKNKEGLIEALDKIVAQKDNYTATQQGKGVRVRRIREFDLDEAKQRLERLG